MQDKTTASARPYLRRYLRIAPICVAVWRAVEAKHFSTIELPRPILDLGCGFGEFARVFFAEPPDVGVDISRTDLRMARRDRLYRSVLQADARRLPVGDGKFPCVISVSTIEHIDDPAAVLREAYRVLRPGGLFALTVPTSKLNDLLLFPRLFRRAGLARLGEAYAGLLNRLIEHVNLLSEEEWLRLVQQAGFEVTLHRAIMSPTATALFDLFTIPALPKRAWRIVFKRRLLRPPPMVSFWERRLLRYVDEDPPEGSNILVVARKPS